MALDLDKSIESNYTVENRYKTWNTHSLCTSGHRGQLQENGAKWKYKCSDVTMKAMYQRKIILFSIKRIKIINKGKHLLSQEIKSAFWTVEIVGDRMSYLVLVSKDSFCERLKHICDHFLKYLMKSL